MEFRLKMSIRSQNNWKKNTTNGILSKKNRYLKTVAQKNRRNRFIDKLNQEFEVRKKENPTVDNEKRRNKGDEMSIECDASHDEQIVQQIQQCESEGARRRKLEAIEKIKRLKVIVGR